MSKKETTETAKVEEKADSEATEEETEEEESSKEETEEEAKDKNTDNEVDLDAEIEKERKAGKPDPNKANEAFKKREAKRNQKTGEEADESDEDKPLTRKDLDEVEARAYKRAQEDRAFELAQDLATSPKQAELMIEVYRNRTFPSTLSLREQMEEVYAIVNRKKLVGERNEALRALKGKGGVNTNSASTHQIEKAGKAPKMSEADLKAIQAAGFSWNGTSHRYEKKLPNGQIIVRDEKTKKTFLIKA